MSVMSQQRGSSVSVTSQRGRDLGRRCSRALDAVHADGDTALSPVNPRLQMWERGSVLVSEAVC